MIQERSSAQTGEQVLGEITGVAKTPYGVTFHHVKAVDSRPGHCCRAAGCCQGGQTPAGRAQAAPYSHTLAGTRR